MKQRKLRSYVMPTLYVIILMFIFGTVSLISTLMQSNPSYLYALPVLKNITATPVIGVDSSQVGAIRPYVSSNINIANSFYEMDASPEEQQKALIYYENTYMKNTGVMYTSEEAFDVIMVLDGKVINIKDDEVLGKYVEVEHNTNLRTIYYSLCDVNLKVGDELKQGEIIGKSGENKISDAKNNLLIEVYYNGTLINPESFYNMDISKLN